MRLLVLGGTAWVSGAVAALAVEAGHDVTCLARGDSGPVPPGARLVRADRTTPQAYAGLSGEWDAVLDVTRHPGWLRSAASALSGRAAYLAFVSTCSVYADDSTPGADESAAVHAPLVGETMESMADYGPAKVACEEAALAGFGAERTLVARPGLIGGPGDGSGRSGYWPWRFAHPATADGAVVVPDAPTLSTQVIDGRDLAAWLLDCCERQAPGLANACGDPVPLPDHLALARAAAGHAGPVLAAEPDWLAAQGVEPWMGPRSMPLWLPLPDYAGFAARSVAAGRALGLRSRPLVETLADTLAWERARRAERPDLPWSAGLTDAEAVELAAAWRRAHEPGPDGG